MDTSWHGGTAYAGVAGPNSAADGVSKPSIGAAGRARSFHGPEAPIAAGAASGLALSGRASTSGGEIAVVSEGFRCCGVLCVRCCGDPAVELYHCDLHACSCYISAHMGTSLTQYKVFTFATAPSSK